MDEERAALLRGVCDFPERRVARAVREYRESDLDALKRMHSAQGFDYPLPDLNQPIFITRQVLEDPDGRVVMAALGRLTCEAYLLADPEAGTPRERYERLQIIEKAAIADAAARGMQDAHCWIPPKIAKRFGRRLDAFGWVRDDAWTPYCKRF